MKLAVTRNRTLHGRTRTSSERSGHDINDLDPKLRERALACKTSDELVKLAKEAGITLTDEQLASVSGAGNWATCTDNWCHDDDIW